MVGGSVGRWVGGSVVGGFNKIVEVIRQSFSQGANHLLNWPVSYAFCQSMS